MVSRDHATALQPGQQQRNSVFYNQIIKLKLKQSAKIVLFSLDVSTDSLRIEIFEYFAVSRALFQYGGGFSMNT